MPRREIVLERGDLIRHFKVTTVEGTSFDYRETWQRRNLLLVALPEMPLSDAATRYVMEITSHDDAFAAFETRRVVSTDPISDIEAPAVVIADRWGEVYLSARGASVSDLPAADEILECLRYITHECPECQGEAR
jgi:hypothetical protein